MTSPMTDIDMVVGDGRDFSKSEHDAFVQLVLIGGEVPRNTLRINVPTAKCLVFMRRNTELLGVAALKNPLPAYRTSIHQKASVRVSEEEFPFELGYVFVLPAARGNRYSHELACAALDAAGRKGVFATSRSDNPAMHATLKKLQFAPAGTPYIGRDEAESIQLFLRPPG